MRRTARLAAGLTALAALFVEPTGASALEKIALGYTAAIGPQYSDIFYGKQLGFSPRKALISNSSSSRAPRSLPPR